MSAYQSITLLTKLFYLKIVISEFVAKFKSPNEFILSEGKQFGRLDVHLLSFKHVNQLHLLLESLKELISLSFDLPVLLSQPVHVSSYVV